MHELMSRNLYGNTFATAHVSIYGIIVARTRGLRFAVGVTPPSDLKRRTRPSLTLTEPMWDAVESPLIMIATRPVQYRNQDPGIAATHYCCSTIDFSVGLLAPARIPDAVQ